MQFPPKPTPASFHYSRGLWLSFRAYSLVPMMSALLMQALLVVFAFLGRRSLSLLKSASQDSISPKIIPKSLVPLVTKSSILLNRHMPCLLFFPPWEARRQPPLQAGPEAPDFHGPGVRGSTGLGLGGVCRHLSGRLRRDRQLSHPNIVPRCLLCVSFSVSSPREKHTMHSDVFANASCCSPWPYSFGGF